MRTSRAFREMRADLAVIPRHADIAGGGGSDTRRGSRIIGPAAARPNCRCVRTMALIISAGCRREPDLVAKDHLGIGQRYGAMVPARIAVEETGIQHQQLMKVVKPRCRA